MVKHKYQLKLVTTKSATDLNTWRNLNLKIKTNSKYPKHHNQSIQEMKYSSIFLEKPQIKC